MRGHAAYSFRRSINLQSGYLDEGGRSSIRLYVVESRRNKINSFTTSIFLNFPSSGHTALTLLYFDMPLSISQVENEKDYDKICQMDHDAWKKPYNPQLKHFRVNIADRDAAIANTIAKKVKAFRERSSKKFMLKVVDTDTDDIIGYAEWEVNDRPNSLGEKTVATWYPEGSDEREFAERFINGLWGFLGSRVTRPHMGEYCGL